MAQSKTGSEVGSFLKSLAEAYKDAGRLKSQAGRVPNPTGGSKGQVVTVEAKLAEAYQVLTGSRPDRGVTEVHVQSAEGRISDRETQSSAIYSIRAAHQAVQSVSFTSDFDPMMGRVGPSRAARTQQQSLESDIRKLVRELEQAAVSNSDDR